MNIGVGFGFIATRSFAVGRFRVVGKWVCFVKMRLRQTASLGAASPFPRLAGEPVYSYLFDNARRKRRVVRDLKPYFCETDLTRRSLRSSSLSAQIAEPSNASVH